MEIPTYLMLGATGGIGSVLCERLAKRVASLVVGRRDPGNAWVSGPMIGADGGVATRCGKVRV